MKEINIHHAKTVNEAVNDMWDFLNADIWYASRYEWKCEEDAEKYIDGHFKILLNEIRRIKRNEKRDR